MTLGGLAGLVGGAIGEIFLRAFERAVPLEQIGFEALFWSISLSLAAGAAYWPSHWATRGIVGGITYGLARGGLTALLAFSTSDWAEVMGSEITGGVIGGLILAYLWRPGEMRGTTKGGRGLLPLSAVSREEIVVRE